MWLSDSLAELVFITCIHSVLGPVSSTQKDEEHVQEVGAFKEKGKIAY